MVVNGRMMSARKRWLRRANAWIAGSGRAPDAEADTAQTQSEGEESEVVAAPAPVATRTSFGWAARSGMAGETSPPPTLAPPALAERSEAKTEPGTEERKKKLQELGNRLEELEGKRRDSEEALAEMEGKLTLGEKAAEGLRERIERLTEENSELKESLGTKGGEMRELEQKIEKLTAHERVASERSEARLSEQAACLEQTEAVSERRNVRLRARKERWGNLLGLYRAQSTKLDVLQKALDDREEECRERRVQCDALESDRVALNEARERLTATEAALVMRVEELEEARKEGERRVSLQKELDDAVHRVAGLEEQLNQAQEERSAQEAKVKIHERDLQELRDSGEHWRKKAEEGQGDIDDLRDALAVARRERQQALREKDLVSSGAENHERSMDELRALTDKLKAELAKKEDTLQHVTSEWKAATETLEGLREDSDRGDADREEEKRKSEERLQLVEDERARLRDDLSAAEKRIVSLTSAVEEGKAKEVKIGELDRLKDQFKFTEQELADREQQVNTLRNELAGFSSLLEDRETENARLERHLEQVREEHQDRVLTLKRALAETGKSKDQLQTQMEDLRGTLREVSRELESKRRFLEQVDDAQSERLALEDRLEELERAHNEQGSLLAERESEAERLKAQCQNLESQLETRSQRHLAKASGERERLQAAIESRDQEMRKSQELLSQSRQDLRQAKRQLDERARELMLAQKDMDRLRDAGVRAVAESREANKEVAGLQTQLAEKERRLDQLSAVMNRERSQFNREDESLNQRVRHLERALQDRERDLKDRESDYRRLSNQLESLRADLRVSEARLKRSDEDRNKGHLVSAQASQSKLAQMEALVDRWKEKYRLLERKLAMSGEAAESKENLGGEEQREGPLESGEPESDRVHDLR